MQFSWISHPVHGVYLEPGYHTHMTLRRQYPDLYELDENLNYEPISGWSKVHLVDKTIEIGFYQPKYLGEHLQAISEKICSRCKLKGFTPFASLRTQATGLP